MAIKVSGTTVVDDSRNITNVIGVGDTATTLFYGDGSGLSNTGAVLSAGSGSQRLVVTSGTSGIMTTAATNANLTWDSTSGTLSATNVSIAGTLTYEDVTNVDSIGIVTARSGVNVTSGSVVISSGGLTASGVSTFSSQIQSTQANSTADGGGQIYLNGASGNRIDFNGNGVAAPTTTTRSAGTKIVLYPNVGASQVDYALGMESNTLWSSVPDAATQFKWYAGTTNVGTLTGGGNFTVTGNVTGYSDETLKDNIQTIPNALSKVTQLRGVEFDRNDMEGNPHQIGVIAQEVEQVIPEVVTTHDDGIKSVAYGNLVGVLIEAIKELKEEVNELKARLEEV